jgi:hypothetical protein
MKILYFIFLIEKGLIMVQIVKRGFDPKDEIEFSSKWQEVLNKAGAELFYLLNQGYDMKSSITFIGNHYMLSKRQRLAIARIVSTKEQLKGREEKTLDSFIGINKVNIDGFNTIITLEVALSNSLLIEGMDGTIRDMAGLRGTYHVIDKTENAIILILDRLEKLEVNEVIFYLDRPISNSGRLKELIINISKNYKLKTEVEVINDVDRVLEKLEGVITSDAIIIDKCVSWFNLNKSIIYENVNNPWIFNLTKGSSKTS